MAKNSGNGALLWPKGCTSVEEIPYDLASAIDHAYFILNMQERCSKDELPPSWMWPFDLELKSWFEEVEIARKEKYSPGGSTDEEPEGGYVQNELARGRGRG